MGFFDKLKQAFGFNDEGDELDAVLDVDVARQPYINPFRPEEREDVPQADAAAEVEPASSPAAAQQAASQPASPADAAPVGVTEPPAAEVPTQQTPTAGDVQAAIDHLLTAIKGMQPASQPSSPSPNELSLQQAKAEVQAQASRITVLEQQLAGANHERELLQERCATLERRAADSAAGKEVAALRQVVDRLTDERDSAEKACQAAEQKQHDAERRLEEANGEAQGLRDRLSEADAVAQRLTEAVEQLGRARAELERERARAAELNALVDTAATERAAHDAALKAAGDREAEARAEAQALAERLREMEKVQRRDANLRNQRDVELANQIDDLTQRLKSRNRQMEALEKQLQQTEDTLLKERTRGQSDLEALEAQLEQTRKRHEETAARCEALLLEVRQARAECDKAVMRSQALQVRLDELERQCAAQQDELASLRRQTVANARLLTSDEPSAEPIVEKTVEKPAGQLLELPFDQPVEDAEPTAPAAAESAADLAAESAADLAAESAADLAAELAEPAALAADPVVAEPLAEPAGAFDDDLDDIDWLVPSPPSQPLPDPEPEEPKPHVTDPRQLSLFSF